MAKTESTAVNNLIALAQTNERTSKPIVHPDDDLFARPPTRKQLKNTPSSALPTIPKPNVAAPSRMTGNLPALTSAGPVLPLPRTRAPIGTSQLTLPEHQMRMKAAPAPRGTTIPPIPQQAVPQPMPKHRSGPVFAAAARISEPVFTARPPTSEAPIANAYVGAPRPSTVDMTGDVVRAENWFEASRAVEKFEDETYVGTSPHVKYDRTKDSFGLVKKLILPAIGFIVIGAMIGGFIAFRGDKKPDAVSAVAPAPTTPTTPTPPTSPTATQIAAPDNVARAQAVANGANTGVPTAAPGAPPTDVHEVQTTRGVVTLADVRIDSKPAGATVTLVEHTASGDKRAFIGSTPIATSVDASHQFEVELELAGHAIQTTHLDPAKTTRVSFDFKRAPKTVADAPIAAPAQKAAVVVVRHAVAAKAPKRSEPSAALADPGFDSAPVPVPVPVKTEPVENVATGTGTLMLSSKPPCEIMIDGKATGMSTPQRAMELPAGAHKITLVNEAAGINKTVMVQITAGQPTKLVKDLLAN